MQGAEGIGVMSLLALMKRNSYSLRGPKGSRGHASPVDLAMSLNQVYIFHVGSRPTLIPPAMYLNVHRHLQHGLPKLLIHLNTLHMSHHLLFSCQIQDVSIHMLNLLLTPTADVTPRVRAQVQRHIHTLSQGAAESRSEHASYPEPSRTVHMSTNVATKATKRVSHQVTSMPPQYPKEQGCRVTIPEGTTRKHQLQVTVPKTIHNSTSVSIVKHSDRQASDQSRSARVESNACYVEHRDPVSETKKQKVKSVVVSTSSDKKRSRETRVSPCHTKQGSDSRSARSNEKACEEVVNLLKQLYTLVDRQVISDVVAASAAPLNPFNQGLLLEVSSRRIRRMLEEAAGCSSSATSVPKFTSTISKGQPKSEVKPRETIVKKAESIDSGIRKRISETGVSSGIPIKKRRLRRPKCYMKNCKLTMTHVKRHIAGKHLSRSFASWLPMPEEKRMSSINWSLKHLECLLNLDSHEELLSFVLREKWFPEGTKYQLSEEDIDFIKNFHKWSTGQDLLSQPTIDPPSCEAALAHWRVVSTIINYIGEEKVNIAEHDSNEQPRLPVAEHDSSEQPEEAPVREEEKMDTETIVQDESKVCAGAAPAPLDESLLLASADEVSPGSIVVICVARESVHCS